MKIIHKILICLSGLTLIISFDIPASNLPPVCAGDMNVGYYHPQSVYKSIYIWTIEGEEEEEVSVLRYNDSIKINWNTRETGYYTIRVKEIYVFFNGNGDTVKKCEGLPFYDSVLVKGPTDIDIGSDQETCFGEQVTFQTNRSYEEYLWMNGSTDQDIEYGDEGYVWVEVKETYDTLTCSFKDSAFLIVHPLPEVELGEDVSICDNEEYILDAGNESIMWDWYVGSNLNEPYAYDQTITLTENELLSENIDTFRVRVMDQYGCISEDTVVISPCKKSLGSIPTIITPNGDGYNDYFRIKRIEDFPENYQNTVIEIYDRWGKLVFKSKPGYPQPWDGTDLRGKSLPMGSYFYVINVKNRGKPVTGYITIVR